MQLKPFKEILAMSKEKLDEALAPIRARTVRSKAELEMAKLDTDIITKEAKVQEFCTEKEINLPKLLDLLDEVDLLERRRTKYADVLEQLFPTEAK